MTATIPVGKAKSALSETSTARDSDSVADIFHNMNYGPAPEADNVAQVYNFCV